ncbi:MAG: hypothetical protein ACF8LL_10285 [Phycisphaerales bacterium]
MRALILITILAAASGCYYTDANTRLTLSEDISVSVLDPEAGATYETSTDDEPLDIMRRGWAHVAFVVPVDGTDHTYIGRTDAPCTDSTARQRREFPTPTSAIELGGDSARIQRHESFEAPFWAAWDGLLLLPRVIGWHWYNGGEGVSPDISYDRYPDHTLTDTERALWLGVGP